MWETVEHFLNEKSMTQYALAKKMNVSNSTMTELKMGRIKKQSFNLVCKIADSLGVSLDEFRNEYNKKATDGNQ